jgi:hypothetical protein
VFNSDDLLDYYKTNAILKLECNFTLQEIELLNPFEIDIYINSIRALKKDAEAK